MVRRFYHASGHFSPATYRINGRPVDTRVVYLEFAGDDPENAHYMVLYETGDKVPGYGGFSLRAALGYVTQGSWRMEELGPPEIWWGDERLA